MPKPMQILGFTSRDDLIEFLITGLAIVPLLLMAGGWLVEGGVALIIMILLLAAIAALFPPPEWFAEDEDRHDP